ncbi:MAG: hypothetical protein V2I31_11985 [Mariniphaga sp.]|jgi:hypothetical protein|nr:hypothetical protein [Mariniphaga sp.]
MKKNKIRMKAPKNMRELHLMKQRLGYQERLYEKEISGSTADIVDNLTDKLRDLVFQFGSHLILQLIYGKNKKQK